MAVVGAFRHTTNGEYYYFDNGSGSGQDTTFLINPNGASLYLKSFSDMNTTVETVTSTKTFYSNNRWNSSSAGWVELYCTYYKSGYTFSGISTVTGNNASGVTLTSWSNNTLKISFTGLQSGGCLSIKLNWTASGGGGTTYTACTAPSNVYVGASSSATSTTYTCTVPDPGQWYINWTAGGPGTNNPISGYRRRVKGQTTSADYTYDVGASARSNVTSGWGASAAGYKYDCTVMTLGSVSGYNSAYSTAKGVVTCSAGSSSGYTLTCDTNGGSPSGGYSYTKSEWTHQTIETPTRSHYNFGGWYFNSNASNYLNYGTGRAVTGSNMRITFWTDATTYAQGSSSLCHSIFSCADGGGFCLTNETGNYWEFQVYDGGWKKAKVAVSAVTAGYHEWCCVVDKTNKYIYLYLDGVEKQKTAYSGTIAYGSNKQLLLGGELANGSMLANSGFVGKIGNFKLVYSSSTVYGNAAPELENFDVPAQAATVYTYWKAKTSYTISYNANGGSSTPTSQTKYKDESIYLAGAISRSSTVTPVTTTYTTSFNVNGRATSTPSALTNKKTETTTQPYTFNKWAVGSASGSTTYAAGALYTANAGATMYATWTNGTATTTTAFTSITLPTYTLKANYYDGDPGWYTAAIGGIKIGNAGDTFTPSSNQTLYLHPWKCCYVYKSNTWKKAIPYVYKDSWKRAEPWVYKSGWK